MADFAFDPPEEPHFSGMYGRPAVIPQRPSEAGRKLREKGFSRAVAEPKKKDWPHPYSVALPKR